MLDKISPRRNFMKYNIWKNGEYGYIYDLHNDGKLRFVGFDYNEETGANICREFAGMEEYTPIIASGFIGFFISRYASARKVFEIEFVHKEKPDVDIPAIFDEYTKQCEEDYVKRHRRELDSWKRDLHSEFYTNASIEEEEIRYHKDRKIYEFLSDEDVEFVEKAFDNYLMYLTELGLKIKNEKANLAQSTHSDEMAPSNADGKEMAEYQTVVSQSVIDDDLPLPAELNTERAQKYFKEAIQKGLMTIENGTFKWIGLGKRGGDTHLAYFCGKVYNYRWNPHGNRGEIFPETSLFELFGVTRLNYKLWQAYNAKTPQRWRLIIDELFEE